MKSRIQIDFCLEGMANDLIDKDIPYEDIHIDLYVAGCPLNHIKWLLECYL